jgi:hypothetical protein
MPLKVIAYNVNDITRQRYEISEDLQYIQVDVVLL